MLAKNIVLFDDLSWSNLLPLTYTRPVADLRVGITTIREKWLNHYGKLSFHTKDYLSEKYPEVIEDDNLFINASLIPSPEVVNVINNLEFNEGLLKEGLLLAFRSKEFNLQVFLQNNNSVEYKDEVILINHTWDVFARNAEVLRQDFEILTKGRNSKTISETNNVLNSENIFLEEGAKVEFATINASGGPVYIGKDAEIMEGAIIRGPFALCEHSTVKMGAKIYEDSTIGPWCKVAGEVHNSVLLGYANKGHDGYLGNSVLGEWCNIGADSNTSNLKNNYAKVKLWDYNTDRFIDTGMQFCGLIMGDHSKCGINTMFNTGTVVGVSANIFGSGFPRNFIPSYSWGGAGGFTLYTFKKAIETAKIVMARRNLELDEIDQNILEEVYKISEKYRK